MICKQGTRIQETNKLQYYMKEGDKRYDLEERSFVFAKDVIDITNRLSETETNRHFVRLVIRSTTSIGANYREVNDALGKKDFVFRLRISRKEVKETVFWLKLIQHNNFSLSDETSKLVEESIESRNILSSIIKKTK